MLNRASEVGLLTAVDEGRHYTIHPAVPWYFKRLFESYYRDRSAVECKFVSAMEVVGEYYRREYNQGKRHLIAELNFNEQNLLHALRLAREHHLWNQAISLLWIIDKLYDESGRRVEFARLLAEAVPDFVDAQSDDPRPSMEEWWFPITLMRAEEARHRKDSREKADRLYARLLAYSQAQAGDAAGKPAAELDSKRRTALSELAAVLHRLGMSQWMDGDPACVDSLKKSLDLSEMLGDLDGAVSSAWHLGHAYTDLPAIRDYAKAETFYRRKLDLAKKRGDPLSWGDALHELGQLLYRRVLRAVEERNIPEAEINSLFNQALQYAREALDLLGPNSSHSIWTHHLLGNIYDDAGRLEAALPHYKKAIQIAEFSGETSSAAKMRREVARAYLKRDRLDDALAYALAALRGLQAATGTAVAAGDLDMSFALVAEIHRLIQEGKP
jgi:tetratricopeptide (TPR) repeat protein